MPNLGSPNRAVLQKWYAHEVIMLDVSVMKFVTVLTMRLEVTNIWAYRTSKKKTKDEDPHREWPFTSTGLSLLYEDCSLSSAENWWYCDMIIERGSSSIYTHGIFRREQKSSSWISKRLKAEMIVLASIISNLIDRPKIVSCSHKLRADNWVT
jgi:hypothetical protein